MTDKTLMDDMALLIKCFPSTSKPHEILNSAYKRITELERQNQHLQENNTKLKLENRELKATNAQLNELIDSQLQTINALKLRLQGLSNKYGVDGRTTGLEGSIKPLQWKTSDNGTKSTKTAVGFWEVGEDGFMFSPWVCKYRSQEEAINACNEDYLKKVKSMMVHKQIKTPPSAADCEAGDEV